MPKDERKTQLMQRPIAEFRSAVQVARKLKISRPRLYALAQDARLNPPPLLIGGTMLFHETTSYERIR